MRRDGWTHENSRKAAEADRNVRCGLFQNVDEPPRGGEPERPAASCESVEMPGMRAAAWRRNEPAVIAVPFVGLQFPDCGVGVPNPQVSGFRRACSSVRAVDLATSDVALLGMRDKSMPCRSLPDGGPVSAVNVTVTLLSDTHRKQIVTHGNGHDCRGSDPSQHPEDASNGPSEVRRFGPQWRARVYTLLLH